MSNGASTMVDAPPRSAPTSVGSTATPASEVLPGLDVTPAFAVAPEGLWARAGRRLRVLAGVDEQILAWVPSDRARYTALGGVVLGTATIAAFSMLVGLTEILDGFSAWLIVPMLVWGAFVLNLDRWLVSSSTGTRWHRSLSILVPRVVLACCFGVIIAEPLVLRIFEPAIERHILDQRQVQLQTLTSSLLRCNPDPTADEATSLQAQAPDCADLRLNLAAEYAAAAQELAGKQREAAVLRETIAADDAEQSRRDTLASNECSGTPGPGTTGIPGRGRECQQRELEAEEFRRTHPVGDRAARLAVLNGQIEELLADVAELQQSYQLRRDEQIREEVDKLESQHGAIGLLERLKALHELTADNAALAMSTWFVRFFFILVDCLPVLVKFFGGKTRYEALVDIRAEGMRKVFEQGVRTHELDVINDFKARQLTVEADARKFQAAADVDLRWHDASLDVELGHQIDLLVKRMRSGSPGSDDHTTSGATSPVGSGLPQT